MSRINFSKQWAASRILPHLVAVVVFLIITVIFYSPIFFENKVPRQGDVLQGLGAGQEINEYREATGEEALWTNSMFGGMPAYLISVLYPGEEVVNVLHNIYSLWLPRTPDIIFKAMISFYILLLAFGVRPYLAIAGAIAYGLGTFNLISLEAGHIWKVDAIAYMPIVLAGIHLTLKSKRIWGFTLTALALAFEIDANHLQITYYLLLVVLCYGITMLVYAIRNNQFKEFSVNAAIVVAATLLAVGTTAGKLWNTYQYGKLSIRGASELTAQEGGDDGGGLDRDYAFMWSNQKMEAFTLLVPDFAGGSSSRGLDRNSETAEILAQNNVGPQQLDQILSSIPTYWGDKPFTGGPSYAGALICFLFFLGCFLAPKEHRIWLIVATVLSIMLSWGRFFPAFNDFMFDYFPGYNKFRVVEMAIVMALLCMPLLGFIGLETLLEKGFNAETQKKFLIGSGISTGLLLLLVVFAGMGSYVAGADQQMLAGGYPKMLIDAIREDRESLLRTDAWRSLFFVAVGVALVYFYMKKKISYGMLAAGLGIFVLIDMWSVGNRYLNEDIYVKKTRNNSYFAPSEADQFILQDTTHARVLNLQGTFQDARTSYFHASIGGYHGAKLQRYQDMIERHFSPEINRVIQQLQQGQRSFDNIPALDMMNAKYFLAGNTKNAVIVNEGAEGNAWFVSNIQQVNTPDEEIDAINGIDPGETAVVDVAKFPVSQTNYNADGSIQLTSYAPNHLKYQVNAEGESFAVFSEIYYADGWQALLDGKEVDHLRANYILRAMPVPAGQHTIEFIFDPASYRVGSTIMIVCSILLVLSLVGSVGYTVREKVMR